MLPPESQGSPALHEARTLLGASARISRIRFSRQASLRSPTKKRCAFLPTPRSRRSSQSWPRFWTRALEEEFGVDAGVASTEAKYTEVLNGGGSGGEGLERLGGHAQRQRILRTRHDCLGVITAAHEKRAREELMTLPRDVGAGTDSQRNISFTTAVMSELDEGSS